MIKKTISHGLTLLKISTWISAIVALLVVLIVSFFVAFPALLKPPIEQQLSSLSNLDIEMNKITFDIGDKGVVLNIHNIDASSPKTEQKIATVSHLKWNIDILSLFEDVYRPSDVGIDALTLYSSANVNNASISVEDIRQLISAETLNSLYFFKSLSIDKTIIQGKRDIEISPMVIKRKESQLLLKISQQKFDAYSADVVATLSVTQSERDKSLILPMLISNDDFSFMSNFRLFSENGYDFMEFDGFLPNTNTANISKYLPAKLIGESTNSWLDRGFISGELENLKLNVKKNLSIDKPIQTKLTAHLNDAELLFNSDWQSLKHLNADITTDGKKITVLVNSTKLNDMDLTDITVQIPNMDAEQLDVEVIGKIDTSSEKLIQFLKTAPLGPTVDSVLEQFTLHGKVGGDMKLVIPLDDRESILDIDLTIKDNLFTTLDGAIVIEDYDSGLFYHNREITSKGVGNIRDIPFDIRINPSNLSDDDKSPFRVELVNNSSGFGLYLRKQQNDHWHARIESKGVKGDVVIIAKQDKPPEVELQAFEINTSDTLKGEWDISPSDLPDMHLSSKGIFVDDYKVPDFSVNLESEDNVLVINNLEFDGIGVSERDLSFNGGWVGGKTSLIAKAKGKGLSEFLKQLNIKEKVEGGEFGFDIRLFCECNPWNMSLKDVQGFATMSVKQGIFTDKDPNIGRILSLLNIRSIAKRLELKVDDLIDKGFVYDDIQADIHIGNSLAKIDKFKLNSSSSTIDLTGNSDIVEQEYYLEAKVMPAVSDAVPAVTYLAGGGLAGLGVWLVDEALFDGKLINKVIDKVVEFKYKITGPWDEPKIENISTLL